MRQILLVVTVLGLLSACGGCGGVGFGHRRPSRAEIVVAENDRAVLVTGMLPDGRGYRCSGVLVSDHQVVTAAHCAPDGALIVAERRDGTESIFAVEVILPGLDMARLETVPGWFGDAPAPLELADSPQLDQRYCIAAAWPRRDHKCGDGQFTPGEDGMWYFDAVVEHGNSGSAVYDDAGRIAGIVSVLYDASNGQVMGTGAHVPPRWLVRPE